MRDLRDLKKEEEGPGSKKAPPFLIIGLLGLLVFFALFFFFKGGKQTPTEMPPVSQLPPQQIDPLPDASDGGESAFKDPALKPGQMRFETKKGEASLPSDTEANRPPGKTDSAAADSPLSGANKKEDLTFLKTLKEKKENNVALKSKKESSASSVSQSAGRYTIQVASFSEKKGAESLAARLRKKGFESYVVIGEIPKKGKWYRVRIGHYASRREAEKVADEVHASEKLDFFITSDNK